MIATSTCPLLPHLARTQIRHPAAPDLNSITFIALNTVAAIENHLPLRFHSQVLCKCTLGSLLPTIKPSYTMFPRPISLAITFIATLVVLSPTDGEFKATFQCYFDLFRGSSIPIIPILGWSMGWPHITHSDRGIIKGIYRRLIQCFNSWLCSSCCLTCSAGWSGSCARGTVPWHQVQKALLVEVSLSS